MNIQITKEHARILLKAIAFWREHYDMKYRRWVEEFVSQKDLIIQ